MTPTEFKSWFEGFTEAMSGVPTKAQWGRIKERVSQIDGKPTTERVFIDRYYPPYIRYWPCIGSVSGVSVGNAGGGGGCVSNTTTSFERAGFNASSAMFSLGCIDAAASAGH